MQPTFQYHLPSHSSGHILSQLSGNRRQARPQPHHKDNLGKCKRTESCRVHSLTILEPKWKSIKPISTNVLIWVPSLIKWPPDVSHSLYWLQILSGAIYGNRGLFRARVERIHSVRKAQDYSWVCGDQR